MNLEGNVIWIPFQYERLPKFCFQCGTIRHGIGGCAKRSDLRNQGEPSCGLWLRAASPSQKIDRNRGFAPKPNKTHPEPSDPEGPKRHRTSGARREDDRRRDGAGNGEAGEPVEESNYAPSKNSIGGFCGANRGIGAGGFHTETHAEEGNTFMVNNGTTENFKFKSTTSWRDR